ncbi:YkgJ family cysteine cluster protein [Stella sp.]|uniref:YkgJ family cysteine cluster protein n=1 Tax=Stella sp. TaxID=2912054 RepID=UPI0035B28061
MATPPDVAVPEEADASALCQACGACCAYSSDWPRFSLESEAELARIPDDLVAASRGGMRCDGARCAALDGVVGSATRCRIYADRPLVCRDCGPGDDACRIARQHHGLPPLRPSV